MEQILGSSHAGALALRLEAVKRHDAWWTRSSLYGPLEHLTLERQLTMTNSPAWQAALFDDGARLVAGSTGRHVGVFDVATGEVLARRKLGVDAAREEARRLLVVDGGRGSKNADSTSASLGRWKSTTPRTCNGDSARHRSGSASRTR
jgi:hypothetical protein